MSARLYNRCVALWLVFMVHFTSGQCIRVVSSGSTVSRCFGQILFKKVHTVFFQESPEIGSTGVNFASDTKGLLHTDLLSVVNTPDPAFCDFENFTHLVVHPHLPLGFSCVSDILGPGGTEPWDLFKDTVVLAFNASWVTLKQQFLWSASNLLLVGLLISGGLVLLLMALLVIPSGCNGLLGLLLFVLQLPGAAAACDVCFGAAA